MIHSLSFPSWCFQNVLQTCRINTFKEKCKSIALKSEEMVCIAFCPLLENSQLIRVCLASWCFHLDGIKPHIPPRPKRLHRSAYSTVVLRMTSLGLNCLMWKSNALQILLFLLFFCVFFFTQKQSCIKSPLTLCIQIIEIIQRKAITDWNVDFCSGNVLPGCLSAPPLQPPSGH